MPTFTPSSQISYPFPPPLVALEVLHAATTLCQSVEMDAEESQYPYLAPVFIEIISSVSVPVKFPPNPRNQSPVLGPSTIPSIELLLITSSDLNHADKPYRSMVELGVTVM